MKYSAFVFEIITVTLFIGRLQKKMNLKLPHCHHSHWKELEKKLKMLFLFFFYDEK